MLNRRSTGNLYSEESSKMPPKNLPKETKELMQNDKVFFPMLQLITEILLVSLKFFYHVAEAIFRLVVPVSEKSVMGEIVLITGAGSGIGRELAIQYASQAATVVCWDVNEKGNLETAQEISARGYPKAHAYVCDVSNRDQVTKIADRVRRDVGKVDILINNAGIMPCHSFLNTKPEVIEKIININLMAHFWTLQAFLPQMIKTNHGHIVALSSFAGLVGIRNVVPYCASKYAVRGLMESLLREMQADRKCKIKLTTIYPFGVSTGLFDTTKIRCKISFLTETLNACDVAKYIMSAQRRDVFETTVPRYLLSLVYFLYLFPRNSLFTVTGFLNGYVDE